MEMPILKTWVQTLVSDWLTAWLVDPSRWDVDLNPEPDPAIPELDLGLDYEKTAGVGLDKHQLSKGVLTITLSGVNKPGEGVVLVSGMRSVRLQYIMMTTFLNYLFRLSKLGISQE